MVGQIPSGSECTLLGISVTANKCEGKRDAFLSVPVRQTPGARRPCFLSLQPGDRGRLRSGFCWLWHRHLTGTHLRSKVWIQRGQQPGGEVKERMKDEDVAIMCLYVVFSFF